MMESNEEIIRSLSEMFGVLSLNSNLSIGHANMNIKSNGEILFSIPTPADRASRLIKRNMLSGEIVLLYLMNLCSLHQGSAMKVYIGSNVIKVFDYVKINFLDLVNRNLLISKDYRNKIEETIENPKIVKGLSAISHRNYKSSFFR